MKYDEGIKKIKEINNLIDNLMCVLGHKSNIDKNSLNFKIISNTPEIESNGYCKLGVLYISARYGYYGNSSVKDVISDEFVRIICEACNKLEKEILKEAIRILDKKKKDIAYKLKEDAENVLSIINEITSEVKK